MSDFDSLREDIGAVAIAVNTHFDAVKRYTTASDVQVARLWSDIAELREEVHAVANRLEALTSFVVSDPAEVAAAIVNDANRATLKEVRNDD